MQVNFRYSKKEFLHSRRFNRMAGPAKWKISAMIGLSLVPSILLSMLSDDNTLLLAVALIGMVLFAAIAWVFYRQPKMFDQHDHTLTLSSETLRDEYSHSILEICWKRFDEFIEEKKAFLFRRQDRFVIFPKRIFTPEQCEEVRKFASAVEQDTSNEEPVDLFAKHFANSNSANETPSETRLPETHLPDTQRRIYEFTYQQDDFLLALQTTLHVINQLVPKQSESARSRLGPFVSLFIFIFLVWSGFALVSQTSFEQFWTLFRLVFVCVLPLVLLMIGFWIIRKSNVKRIPQTPNELSRLVLTKTGFAVGSPQSVTFTDWRDVETFHENIACFGFKMPNELIQIVPKRIFADEVESKKFIDLAMILHREYRQTFVVTATAVETGNPFQAPNS